MPTTVSFSRYNYWSDRQWDDAFETVRFEGDVEESSR